MTRKLLRLVLSTTLLTPLCAYPLGVGKIQVRSALNQPLDAEIELISVGGDEFTNLAIDLASPQAFTQAGIDRLALLGDLRFSIQAREDGRRVVKVTSTRPIREPVLDFLIEFNWPKGRLMREFAILIDPPPTVVKGPGSLAGRGVPAAAFPPSPAPVTPAVSAGASGKTYGPVAFGETLSAIARQLRPDPSISIQRMMDAILSANPGAFSRPNVNSLLAGKKLRIPSAQDLGVDDSRQVVQQRKPAAPASPANAGSAKPASEPAQQVRLVPPESGDRQEMQSPVPAATKAAPSASVETASAPIAAPLMIKLEQGRPKLRIAGLDDLRGHAGVAAAVDSATLTAIQEGSKLPVTVQEKPPAVTSASTANTTAMPPVAGFQEATPATAAVPATETREAVPPAAPLVTAPPAAATNQSTQPPQVKPAPAVKPATAEATLPQSSFLETVFSVFRDPLMAALLGLVFVLLAALSFLMIRRSTRSDEEENLTGEAVLAAAGADHDKAEPVSKAKPSRVGPSLLEKVSSTSLTQQPSSTSPLERVDLLLAVGNYKEAENVLRSALASDSANTALLAKLLDVHFATGDKEGFLRDAQNLRAKLGNDADPLWLRAIQMGRDLCGPHPLFGVADLDATEPAAPGPAPVIPFAKGGAAKPAYDELSLDSINFNTVLPTRPERVSPGTKEKSPPVFEEMNWQLPDSEPMTLANERLPETAKAAPGAKEKPAALDWPLSDAEPITVATIKGAPEVKEKPSQALEEMDWQLPDAEPITVTNTELSKDADVAEKLKGLDFEFDDVSALTPQAEVPASPVAEHPKVDDVLPALDFEFGQAAGEPVTDITATAKGAGDEFAETKLELAAAYLDMGDPVGARSLLEEVLQEGNVEQRQRAKTYMEQLG